MSSIHDATRFLRRGPAARWCGSVARPCDDVVQERVTRYRTGGPRSPEPTEPPDPVRAPDAREAYHPKAHSRSSSNVRNRWLPSAPALALIGSLLAGSCGTSPGGAVQTPVPGTDAADTATSPGDVEELPPIADAEDDGRGEDVAPVPTDTAEDAREVQEDTHDPPRDADADEDGRDEEDATPQPEGCIALPIVCDGDDGPITTDRVLQMVYGEPPPMCHAVGPDGEPYEATGLWVYWWDGPNLVAWKYAFTQTSTGRPSLFDFESDPPAPGTYQVHVVDPARIATHPPTFPAACDSLPVVEILAPRTGFWVHLRARDDAPEGGPNAVTDVELYLMRPTPLCLSDHRRIANSWQRDKTYDWGVPHDPRDNPRLVSSTPRSSSRQVWAEDGMFVADAPHPDETWSIAVRPKGLWSTLTLEVGWAGEVIYRVELGGMLVDGWWMVGTVSFGDEPSFDELLEEQERLEVCGSQLTDPPDCSTEGPFPPEICDGIDNDCDGLVDEAPEACLESPVQPSNCFYIQSGEFHVCL